MDVRYMHMFMCRGQRRIFGAWLNHSYHYPHSLRQRLTEPGASLPSLAGQQAPPVLLPPPQRMLGFYECAAGSDQVEAQILLHYQQAFFPVDRLPKPILVL